MPLKLGSTGSTHWNIEPLKTEIDDKTKEIIFLKSKIQKLEEREEVVKMEAIEMSAKNSKESKINSKRDVNMESVSRRSSVSSIKSMVKITRYEFSLKILYLERDGRSRNHWRDNRTYLSYWRYLNLKSLYMTIFLWSLFFLSSILTFL